MKQAQKPSFARLISATHQRHLNDKDSAYPQSPARAASLRTQIHSPRHVQGVLSAREVERKRLLRERLDAITTILTGIHAKLINLTQVASLNYRSMRKRIQQSHRLRGRPLRALQRFAKKGRPAVFDDMGLIPAMRSHIKELGRLHGLKILFTAFNGVETLSRLRRSALYHVLEEALTNIIRHANADHVRIQISLTNHLVLLDIHDDGGGFDVEETLRSNSSLHLGLLGMRQRVEMIGGDLALHSTRGKGTTVCARIPLGGQKTTVCL